MAAVVLGARLLAPFLETHLTGLVGLIALGIIAYGAASWIVNRAELLSVAELLGLSRLRRSRGLGRPRPSQGTH